MYGQGSGPVVVPVVVSTTAAVILPNTGSSNAIINIAVSVAAGLVTWGILYARLSR